MEYVIGAALVLLPIELLIFVVYRLARRSKPYPRMTVDRVTGAIYVYVRPGVVEHTKQLANLEEVIAADYDDTMLLLGVEIIV